ncbi:MAG: hypothetical protein GX580_15615 [Candidatus Hydrogenedens sp.]|nr:hypothetical protein [Candidatus Hydrogenedentota bacterium]NLF59058.1 hypothetical protein [Candidatus Hydrogenedens sp.]
MNKRFAACGIALAVLAAFSLMPNPAAAAPGNPYVRSVNSSGARALRSMKSAGSAARAARSLRTPSLGSSRNTRIPGLATGGSSSNPWTSRNGSSSNPWTGRGWNAADALQGLGALSGRDGLGGYGGNPWQRYGYDRREDDMAKAYREVGIMNAVVALVGIAAQVSQNSAYAPANAAPAPAVERVVVAPARYETVQVWVPPIYDSRTGAQIGGGYHENRSQYVPETYQDVPVRTAVPAYASVNPAYR